MAFIFLTRSSFYFIFTFFIFCSGESGQGKNDYSTKPSSDQFNSPVYLKYLENVETRFYKLLKEIDPEKDLHGINQELAQKYLKEYEESVGNHEEEVATNPILAIQMLGRFYKFGRMYNTNIFNTIGPNDTIDNDVLPNKLDIEDAVEALFWLHYVYDLDAHDLAKGKLQGVQTTAKLPPGHCLEFGKFGMDRQYFTHALQWFDVYLHKLKNGAIDKQYQELIRTMEETVTNSIKETITQHNNHFTDLFKQTGDTYHIYSFTGPIHSTRYSEIKHLTQRKYNVAKYYGTVESTVNPFSKVTHANVLGLCNGGNFQTEKVKAKLKCFLDTTSHPYWTINPLKTEVLNEEPRIIQLHDFISDHTSETFRTMSHDKLERAPPPAPGSAFRAASYAWFRDEELPDLKLLKSIEYITRLNVLGFDSSELLQVAAYSFGGYVSPHYDSFNRETQSSCPSEVDEDGGVGRGVLMGHRVTTFLIYLNEVEKGGRTAFPDLGLAAEPIKNSAVYWYTNLKNTKNDDRLVHAACPIVKGEKWIATKWTHINTNVFKYPCGLDPEE